MGFFSRLFVPRTVRRAMHPVRTVKRAVTPKSVQKARRAMHPISNAVYGAERSLTAKTRTAGSVYRHGSCPIKHRSPGAAQRCRNR